MKTIVWDVDDVLNKLTYEWLAWFKVLHPELTDFEFKQISTNPPHEILKISKSEYLSSLDEFRLTHGSNLTPNEEILTWFEQYGHQFRHMALTAQPLVSAHVGAGWVFKHFSRWIRSFNVVPSMRSSDPDFNYFKNKKEALASFGEVSLFVDDAIHNINYAKELNIPTVLFAAPWNLTDSNSIDEIKEVLNL